MKKISLLIILTIISTWTTFAQADSTKTVVNQVYEVEMATGLRSSGKIWVVVSVVLTLVVGIYILLFSIDRRIKKLENKNH